MAIYIKDGDALIEMSEQRYDAESVLQQLLADHPRLLTGDDDRGRLLLVRREMGVADSPEGSDRWSLDHLFLDEQGVPTLVEVKRGSDTRIRREVVGQMLDYAANAASHWAIERLRGSYEDTQAELANDPDEALRAHAGPDVDVERFWEQVAANLRAGRLRLVFVADEIPVELARVVEFLNGQMPRTEVLAIEVRQYRAPGSDLTMLVPRLIGLTQAARDSKRSATGRVRNAWGESDLVDVVRERVPAPYADRMLAIYEFMRDGGARASWGRGGTYPSVTMWMGEEADCPISIGFYPDNLAINFDFVRDRRSPDELARVAALLRELPGVARFVDAAEARGWRLRPGMMPADVLAGDDAVELWRRALARATTPA
ncbi:MAG TPA: hypothetical protein VHB30_09650 [Solirubrobacteraceae bacterium]|nr:hypothetical protein [Solirubrobacteraceae bacterium]